MTVVWPNLPASQQPVWPDAAEVESVRHRLSELPPLVVAHECDRLTTSLSRAVIGEAFVLQAGDCAETFANNTSTSLSARIRTILQMAVVLTYGASVPVVKVGRLAGQFAKPRSDQFEVVDGVRLPAYRGDAVNGFERTEESRRHDPQRLLQAYQASSSALNLIRAFTQGGAADLRQVHSWNQDFVRHSEIGARYETLAGEIERALAFMNACGVDDEQFRSVSFYSSHEALLLDYEQPLARVDESNGRLYDTSAHMLWIGDRTRALDGAHIDFASKIANPIGCKIGPTTSIADAVAIVEKLNPEALPGRLTLITRLGAGAVRDLLPPVISAVEATGIPVVWMCDPMHGNTLTSTYGRKTRDFADVIGEVRGWFDVHQQLGTTPGGVHIELTGDDVTECLGGGEMLDDAALENRYETLCDPRLNRVQSIELAFLVAEMLQANT